MPEQETIKDDDEVNVWAIRLATLEFLVKLLVVDFFERGPEPAATANDCAELIRRRANKNPPGSPPDKTTLALEEDMNVFFDDVIHHLQGLK